MASGARPERPRRRSLPAQLRTLASRPAAVDAVAAAALALTALDRYRTLTDRAAPATVDSGNWLAFGHALLGSSVRSTDIVYPPVVPLLMAGVTRALGPIVAVGVLGAVSAVLPAVVVYVALRALDLRWWAAVLALVLAGSASVGQATAWGGFPQLLGLAATVAFLIALDSALDRPGWRRSTSVAALFAVVLLTSHFAAIVAVAAAGVVVILATLASGPGRARWLLDRLRLAGLCAVPVVLVLPIYVPLLRAIAGSRPTGADASEGTVGWSNLVEAFDFTIREAPIVWRVLALAAVLAPIAVRDRWRRPEWRLPVAGMVSIATCTAVTHEARLIGFWPLVAVVAAGLWILAARDARLDPSPWLQGVGAAFVVLVLVLQATNAARLFVDQRQSFAIVEPGTYSGMRWLRRTTPADTTLGVSSVGDAPLGWWLEGYVERPTSYASPLRWLSFPDERRRARVANSIFTATFPDERSMTRAGARGIDLLVVTTNSQQFHAATMARFVRRHPDAVVYRNRDVVILTTRPWR